MDRRSVKKGGGQKKRFQYCLKPNCPEKLQYLRAIQCHLHCKTMYCYQEDFTKYVYHVGNGKELISIVHNGVVPGGFSTKKGRHAVFFTVVNPMDDEQGSRETFCDLSRARVALCKNTWKPLQDTVYWCNLLFAREGGLQCYQTMSNAVVLHDTLPAEFIEKMICMKTKEKLYQRESTRPRVVLRANSQCGLQDLPRQAARSSWEAQKDAQSFRETGCNIVDCRVPGISLSTVQQQDEQGQHTVAKLNEKFESHHHKEQFLKDMSQTKKINRFSEASQKLLQDMDQTEIFELCENSKTLQCSDCNSFSEIVGEIWNARGGPEQNQRRTTTIPQSLATSLRRILVEDQSTVDLRDKFCSGWCKHYTSNTAKYYVKWLRWKQWLRYIQLWERMRWTTASSQSRKTGTTRTITSSSPCTTRTPMTTLTSTIAWRTTCIESAHIAHCSQSLLMIHIAHSWLKSWALSHSIHGHQHGAFFLIRFLPFYFHLFLLSVPVFLFHLELFLELHYTIVMANLRCSAAEESEDTLNSFTSLTGYEPNLLTFGELNDSSVPFSFMIPSTDQDVDDLTLGKMLTEAYRGQVDYCVPGGMSVSQSSSSVMFDGSGQFDGEGMSIDQGNLMSVTARNAQIRTLLEEQRKTIFAEFVEKVGHHELHAAHAEEERRLLQGQLWRQKLEFCEVHQQSLAEMEELRKFQSSTFDTIARRKLIEDQNTILELSGRIQELQKWSKLYERF